MKHATLIAGLLLVGLIQPPAVTAAGGEEWVHAECVTCHALERPDYEALGIQERIDRKGPPLYYAGNKFQQAWLESWLQNPVRLRPAGIFPPAAVRESEKFDVVDPDQLITHPTLSPTQARDAAAYLMSLRPHDDRLAINSYEPGNIAQRMGQLNFSKFNGCDGCHSDEPGYGGLSGPELYTAWQRLQPKFIASYIADPVAWDPNTLMPASGLNDDAVARLTNYLKLIGEETP